ncbi:hypothetical protein T11_11083 [Trichinella zimbabwensis]|uniref:Uncharacterized protein n=1 Tax=Trichinella zimbabwensis TaxID=268475 RepID=A0A0V1H7D1_9BILA|nr:hypothetical protein T11_11083 [Trichinella zimbabwensis]
MLQKLHEEFDVDEEYEFVMCCGINATVLWCFTICGSCAEIFLKLRIGFLLESTSTGQQGACSRNTIIEKHSLIRRPIFDRV